MIRLWDTKTGEKYSEFRRGSSPCTIEHLAFDQDSNFLTCTSDKTTVHIFKVPTGKGEASGNTKSMFSMLSSVVSAASSEWSFAQVKYEENPNMPKNLIKTIACVHKDKVRILTN